MAGVRTHLRTPLRMGLYLTSNHSELSSRDTQHWYNDNLFVRSQLLSLTYLEFFFFLSNLRSNVLPDLNEYEI